MEEERSDRAVREIREEPIPQDYLDEMGARVKARLAASDRARVKKAAQSYGSERAKKFFARALAEVGTQDAA